MNKNLEAVVLLEIQRACELGFFRQAGLALREKEKDKLGSLAHFLGYLFVRAKRYQKHPGMN